MLRKEIPAIPEYSHLEYKNYHRNSGKRGNILADGIFCFS